MGKPTNERMNLFGGYQGNDVFKLAVTLGKIPAWSWISTWHEHESVTNTQQELTNGGATLHDIRVLPTSPAVVSLVSTSAEDGAGTATGALAVLVKYLDENFERQQEVVTLNGLTPATTTGTAMRIEQCLVTAVGSTGAAVGTISISIGGNIQSRIKATQNETREIGFTVPEGFQFIPENVVIQTAQGGKDISADFAFEFRFFGSDVWYTLRSLELLNQSYINQVIGTTALPSKADFRVLVTGSSANGPPAFANFRGLLVESRYL